MLDDELDNMYGDLEDTMVDVGSSVRGDKNFGDDSPLYGAMGFKRKSERASGGLIQSRYFSLCHQR